MIDTINKRILEELEKDSRLSTGNISKKTGIPQTTVHNRIKKLIQDGVIKKYTIKVDSRKMGDNITAFILILFDTQTMKKEKLDYETIAKNIAKISGVKEFAYTTGRYDIIIKVKTKSMEELGNITLEQLRKIPGVSRTESIIVMNYFD